MSLDLDALYIDLHRNPELSFAEHRTAGIIADSLTNLGYAVVTGIGGTGVVGVFENGDGPTVLLRADMDALPVEELTGLDYASTARGTNPAGEEVAVMHACGHDVHVTCLLGAAERLADERDRWSGRLIALFQPAEELGTGAAAMVKDGLYERVPRPDVVLGQHVTPAPAGVVGAHPGPAFAGADEFMVTLHGQGGHGSRPETTVDPIVMAAATVMRLQTVVSREVAGGDSAVVSVGTLHAGTKPNIIPADATLGVNIRSFRPEVRDRVIAGVKRIVNAEAQASGAQRMPTIEHTTGFPPLINDADATARTMDAFRERFGADRVIDPGAVTGSEDVGELASAVGVPLVYWLLGGVDPGRYQEAVAAGRVDQDIASNHSAYYAPVPHPTLEVGVDALVTAGRAWLN